MKHDLKEKKNFEAGVDIVIEQIAKHNVHADTTEML